MEKFAHSEGLTGVAEGDRITGVDAMAEYLGISRRHFLRLKAKYKGTERQLPVFTRFVGEHWGKRTRTIWVFKEGFGSMVLPASKFVKNGTFLRHFPYVTFLGHF